MIKQNNSFIPPLQKQNVYYILIALLLSRLCVRTLLKACKIVPAIIADEVGYFN